MIRKLTIGLSIILLSTAVNLQAQTLNVAQQGDKALLFNFVGLSTLNLNAYQGGIGGKYFLSDGLAVRAMLLFGLDNKTTSGVPQSTDNSLSFGIGGGIEYHLPLASRLSPYLGGVFSFLNSAETTNPGGGRINSTSFGLGAIGGLEYFFNQNLSLGAEYQFGISSTNSSETGSPSTNELKLGFQTAGLTLAAYF
jgi:opacity protein-like surface antigen